MRTGMKLAAGGPSADSAVRRVDGYDWQALAKDLGDYGCYPLPALVERLRIALYRRLAAVANEWNGRMGIDRLYPEQHTDLLKICHDAGQVRPTPLVLRYGPGDFNCLHQDLYGDIAFPIQVAILLSAPGRDFTGGELLLTEQRPRMQSRAEVVPLRQGDAVAFAVHDGR